MCFLQSSLCNAKIDGTRMANDREIGKFSKTLYLRFAHSRDGNMNHAENVAS